MVEIYEYSLNKPAEVILAILEILEGESHRVHYVRPSIQRAPDFGAAIVHYNLAELTRGEKPV